MSLFRVEETFELSWFNSVGVCFDGESQAVQLEPALSLQIFNRVSSQLCSFSSFPTHVAA